MIIRLITATNTVLVSPGLSFSTGAASSTTTGRSDSGLYFLRILSREKKDGVFVLGDGR